MRNKFITPSQNPGWWSSRQQEQHAVGRGFLAGGVALLSPCQSLGLEPRQLVYGGRRGRNAGVRANRIVQGVHADTGNRSPIRDLIWPLLRSVSSYWSIMLMMLSKFKSFAAHAS